MCNLAVKLSKPFQRRALRGEINSGGAKMEEIFMDDNRDNTNNALLSVLYRLSCIYEDDNFVVCGFNSIFAVYDRVH